MDLDFELGALAAQEDLPAPLVRRLLQHPVARREAARLRRDLTGEQIEEIIALGSGHALAANPWVPAPVKARLAEHPDPTLRYAAAASATDEPPGLLARLADDADPLVRSFLTMNENLPAELVARLARDPDPDVRKWLPQHCRHVPQAVRRALFTDADPDVRRAAVAFWPPPTDLLPDLLADPSTRACAARHSPPTPELARDPDPAVRRAVAAHPDLPPELRDLLAQDPDILVRNEIACRTDTPPHLREQLAPTLTTQDPAEAFLLGNRSHTCPSPDPAPPALTENQAQVLLARAGL
ncbi:HEAT repeat domain-containing protein [Kitasatospora purpeofusca]|uniref:HEAT repeat domain-containing protein n=1 Tax=Kitasatospora purpeofusca TaxID=67352 RepID=UPI0035E07CE3